MAIWPCQWWRFWPLWRLIVPNNCQVVDKARATSVWRSHDLQISSRTFKLPAFSLLLDPHNIAILSHILTITICWYVFTFIYEPVMAANLKFKYPYWALNLLSICLPPGFNGLYYFFWRSWGNIITKCQFQALEAKRFQTELEPTSVTQRDFLSTLKYYLC